MCGHVLGSSNTMPFTVESLSVIDQTGASYIDIQQYYADARQERCKLIIYLLTQYLVSPMKEDGCEDTDDWRYVTRQFLLDDVISETNFTIAHALSLLLQGDSVRTPLTDQQKRSKKIRYYESEELHVVDLMGSRFSTAAADGNGNINTACSMGITNNRIMLPASLGANWTPVHMAVVVNNAYLLQKLLDGVDLSSPIYSNLFEVYIQIISTTNVTADNGVNALSIEQRSFVFEVLVTAISKSKNYGHYLKPSLLYEVGVNLVAPPLVKVLVNCIQLNPNAFHESASDESSKCTALHQVCACIGNDDVSKYYSVLEAFATNPDRLDLLVEDPYGNTCVDIAVQARNFKLLKVLVSMRKMDVIERLLLSRYGGPSLLMELESENLQLAKDCGYAIQPFPSALVAEAGAVIATNEAVDSELQEVEASVEPMDVGDAEVGASITEDASLPLFTSTDDNNAEITLMDSSTQGTSVNPTTEQDRANLARSNEAIYFVLELVGAMVGSDCHVDTCYHEGLVFSDYCDRVQKEMTEEVEKAAQQMNEMALEGEGEEKMESMPTEVEIEVTIS